MTAAANVRVCPFKKTMAAKVESAQPMIQATAMDFFDGYPHGLGYLVFFGNGRQLQSPARAIEHHCQPGYDYQRNNAAPENGAGKIH